MAKNWTQQEVDATIHSYFHMLKQELSGVPYSKAKHRRQLIPQLNNRSESSIEFKHQNISAVLLRYHLPSIIGYKPMKNYQLLLEESVLSFLAKHSEFDDLFDSFSFGSPRKQGRMDFSKVLVDPPVSNLIKESDQPSYKRRNIAKPNYLALEQSNRKLGELGEEFVMEYEKWRLLELGKASLADKVEWISQEKGDGAGFDILSRNSNGTDRYIEVKTTKLSRFTPIYFTRNELTFSQEKSSQYIMYRVFEYGEKPKLFQKQGALDEICLMEATQYIGRF